MPPPRLSRSAGRSENPVQEWDTPHDIENTKHHCLGTSHSVFHATQLCLVRRQTRANPTRARSKAEGSGTGAADVAIGMDWRQLRAKAFKSAESTTPSTVKSPPDHCATLCWGQKYVGNLALILDRCDAERPVRSDSHNRHGFSTHSDQYRNTYGSSTPHDP